MKSPSRLLLNPLSSTVLYLNVAVPRKSLFDLNFKPLISSGVNSSPTFTRSPFARNKVPIEASGISVIMKNSISPSASIPPKLSNSVAGLKFNRVLPCVIFWAVGS